MSEQPETGNCFYCGWHTTEIIGWWCEDDWGRRDCAKSPTGMHITYPAFWVQQHGLTPHPEVRRGEEVEFLPLLDGFRYPDPDSDTI